ncbi:MAG: dihydroorotate dehydrogenase electron transfer subunit [Candidatus Poribacteria bacterium]|nr:dihydroorotate dehydrogenase electron transfer subunit [Candidatus Poribacteria bacterium]
MRDNRSLNTYDVQTAILSNEEVAEAHYLLRCECAEIAQHARPGQFVHVMVSQDTGMLLRRPFTIYTVEGNEITMLYQIIGDGTKRLSEMLKGEPLQVLGPLGNTFDFTTKPEPAILVGGGAGIASLMLLAVALRENGIQTLGLVGAQRRSRLLSVADLESIGISVHIATDDGSIGHHGYVTDILADLLEKTDGACPIIYACGPHGMLSAVTKIAIDFGVPAQIAMENRMGCAMGVCLGCVCPVRIDADRIEYQRVCTEGPVFNAADIAWDVS